MSTYKISGGGVLKLPENLQINHRDGKEWELYKKWIREGNKPELEDLPPRTPPTLLEVKAQKISTVENHVTILQTKMYSNVQQGQLAWFFKRHAEALVYSTAAPQDTPMIVAEASAMGKTTIALVNKLKNTYNTLYPVQAAINGNRTKHIVNIRNLTTIPQVKNYDIKTGWPNVVPIDL